MCCWWWCLLVCVCGWVGMWAGAEVLLLFGRIGAVCVFERGGVCVSQSLGTEG